MPRSHALSLFGCGRPRQSAATRSLVPTGTGRRSRKKRTQQGEFLGTQPARVRVMRDRPLLLASRPACGMDCASRDAECEFQVAWAINVHMKLGAVDHAGAFAQHLAFIDALDELGARLVHVPFVHGAFDSVFTKDNAVLVVDGGGNRRALVGSPRHPERRREQASRARSLAQLRFETVSARHPLEGGDAVVLPGAENAFLGHGFRSSPKAVSELETFLGGTVTPLELADPRLYHLDMALAVLSDRTALVCNEAFTPRSLALLRAHPSIGRIIEVPLDEALSFGVNLVEVGNTIVWGATAPRTTAALVAMGWRVKRVELDQFHLAGGSAACLVAPLHERSIGTSSPRPARGLQLALV